MKRLHLDVPANITVRDSRVTGYTYAYFATLPNDLMPAIADYDEEDDR